MKVLATIGVMGLACGVFGCEAQECDNEETGADGVCLKSLERFEGDPVQSSTPYTSGGVVTIDSPNGNVKVVAGASSTDVVARFEPFVFRAFDTPQDEIAADLADLTTSVGPDGTNVVVDVDRNGGNPGLGADIRVELPTTFNGVLSINQNNGQTDVDFVGAAVTLLLTSDNGSCEAAVGGSDVSMNCDNGDLTASIGTPATQTGTGFTTGNGSVNLTLPSTGVFNVQAQALDGGVVQINNMPAACTVNAASPSAQTLSCNGATSADPTYQAVASGTSLADVVLSF